MNRSEGELFARAYRGGIECSIGELAGLWGMQNDRVLEQVIAVQSRLDQLGLTLSPGPEVGSYDSPRVLKAPRTDSLVDRLPMLVSAENDRTEFKESIFTDMKRFRATRQLAESPEVTKSALKSVAALMNAEGGTVLLGINDAGEACDGVARDILLRNTDRDHLELTIRNLVQNRLVGVDAESYLTLEWAELDAGPVIGIDVAPTQRPCFLRTNKEVEFFIRRGNRTRSLNLVEFYEHVVENPWGRRLPPP